MQSVRLFTLFLWHLVAVTCFLFGLKHSWVIQNTAVKVICLTNCFHYLVPFLICFLSLVSPNTTYSSLFSLYSNFFHNLSVRTKRSVITSSTMMSASNLMFEQINALLYGYHCLWGGNLSEINIIIWIKNTDTFLLSPAWYFVGCDLICTTTSSDRPLCGSHTSA